MEKERSRWAVMSERVVDWHGERMVLLGERNLLRANEYLREGSLVTIHNHPNDMGSILGAAVVRRLTNRTQTGIIMSSKFGDGQMGLFGKAVLETFADWGIEYLKVYQFYNKKVSMAQRVGLAKSALTRAAEILAQVGGVVSIYPEGTRTTSKLFPVLNKGLIEPQPGAGFLAQEAGVVLPVVTDYRFWSSSPVVRVLPPMRIDGLYSQLEASFGRKQARRLLLDGLMLQMARSLPKADQGVYKERLGRVKSWGDDDEQTRLLRSVMNQLDRSRI